jgi:iron complex outermembrane receptor protein/hemoglobin/transferrin/lactoferrin receptor protein
MSIKFFYKDKLYIIFIITLYFLTISHGQTDYSTIEGRVTDSNNRPLVGANIILPELDRGATTNNQGQFKINQVPAGKFKLAVKYIGYESKTELIHIKAGETIHLNYKLNREPIESEPFVITGSPVATDPMDSPQDISYISGREKIRIQSTSLGETVSSLPGVYNMSAGAVAGKPVIRGQTGERIRILNDGIAQEYQQYGERHAPPVDPFNAERVEIIKGAASLLYGSDALGGAVNLIPAKYHFANNGETELGGILTTAYNSNNNQITTGIKVGGSREKLGFKASLVRKSAGNFQTPAVDNYSETKQQGDPKFTGEIDHTDFKQINGSLGAGLLTGVGLVSLNYDQYYNENNFLLPTGTPIGIRLQNQTVTAKGDLPLGNFVFRPKISYQRNQRQAAQPGQSRKVLPNSANVDLVLNVLTGRFELQHSQLANFSGTIGTEIKNYKHDNIGKVPLQPTGHFTSVALFVFEEWKQDRLTLDVGGRFDYRDQKFLGSQSNPLLPADDEKSFSSFSGALGASYKLSRNLTAAANLGRGFRAPSFYNLYVYGYHGGVFAYQIGDPNLKNEVSLDLSASLRFRNKKVRSEVNIFRNSIDNYIFLYSAPNHPQAPQDANHIFAHDQADAGLSGFDIRLETQLLDWLMIGGNYSYIKSEFTSGPHSDRELPLMPPNCLCSKIRFLFPELGTVTNSYLSINYKYVSEKSAAGVYEPFGQFDSGIGPDIPFGVASTDAYSLLNLGAGFDLDVWEKPINFDITVSNLLNNEYRDFLDTYKGYTLAPGRSVNMKVNVPFAY